MATESTERMCTLQVIFLAAVMLAAVSYSNATCRFTDKMKSVNLDYSQYAGKRLQIIYATTNDFSVNVDHAVIDITKTGDSQYFAVNTAYLKNGTADIKNWTINYKDGVMSETYTNKDEQGKNYQSRSYILARGDEGSMYYYRCSDHEYPYDMRFVVVPDGKQLSDDSWNRIKSIDGSFPFTANLIKLPNKLQ